MDLGQIGIMMTGFPESFIKVNQFLNATKFVNGSLDG